MITYQMKISKKREEIIMAESDRIVSLLYIKRYILLSIPYYFYIGISVPKYIENINKIIAELKFSKISLKNEIIYNVIQTSILLWKNKETVILNNEKTCSSEKSSYYWLRYDGIKTLSQWTLMTIKNQNKQ